MHSLETCWADQTAAYTVYVLLFFSLAQFGLSKDGKRTARTKIHHTQDLKSDLRSVGGKNAKSIVHEER